MFEYHFNKHSNEFEKYLFVFSKYKFIFLHHHTKHGFINNSTKSLTRRNRKPISYNVRKI